ncbi:MAG: hypothetical protein JU82_00160 [Sulfuricurvum sp. MLSB]|uniref:hypothetical protein n=1 Tax=Sulfuricurvum sp. MLSB TaxID=1537917 RepID=UPI000502B171|nr:hypothetical protein [Sulfuricurvum sp. MLSB]KFN40940.1 MAG: hypothetical protein JU82_00160 [Sulfuricurvum sp. MLSB]
MHQNRTVQDQILSAIRKKIGNIQIQLESTPNAKARLIVGIHHKDFINRKDALQWLIYTYNLKHLKNAFERCRPKVMIETGKVNKSALIEKAALTLFETIAQQDYFYMETYREIKEHFYALKMANAFTKQEMDHVNMMVIEKLQKLLDDTFIQQRHQAYKKYLERLKSKDNSIE